MTLKTKRIVIALLCAAFLVSLLFVQWMEVLRKQEEAGLISPQIAVPATSVTCVDCHAEETPGIVAQWRGSTHAEKGVACYDCHKAEKGDWDAFDHEGSIIATLVTPLDCSRCHQNEFEEFTASHHAKAGNILHSLDNTLAETVEGAKAPFNPHWPTPGMEVKQVNGLAFAFTGCQQCHGSKVALRGKIAGTTISADALNIGDKDGKLTDDDKKDLGELIEDLKFRAEKGDLTDSEKDLLKKLTDKPKVKLDDLTGEEKVALKEKKHQNAAKLIARDDNGKPLFDQDTWPNTGMGRLNLDGSRGACSACHSRHDFSPRRARQPENCGKCHLGPDHPQKEIYEESKHGVAYRDLRQHMNLDARQWVLGEDYTQAPTCATCHLSGNVRNKGRITHDPGERISWTNRPPISLVMDTDAAGKVVQQTDPKRRERLVVETADVKRTRMKNVCLHCHTPDYVNGFYKQYDNFVILYNEKFAKPGQAIMGELKKQGLLTATPFDEAIEWTWFYLWHHEGRRARHGASMMAPDYAHWHGSFEVAERFYDGLIPQAREIIDHARSEGKVAEARAVSDLIEEILARPEHAWFEAEKKKHRAEKTPAADNAK